MFSRCPTLKSGKFYDRGNGKGTPLDFDITAGRVLRLLKYRRVWSICRILSVIGPPEPQGSGCETAPHFFCSPAIPSHVAHMKNSMKHEQDKEYEVPQVDIVLIEVKNTIMEGTVGGDVPNIPGGGGD